MPDGKGAELSRQRLDRAAAVRVMATERDGLDALVRALDDPAGLGGPFAAAVARIAEATLSAGDAGGTSAGLPAASGQVMGRVILTGMGKSGLVARKIAATLASTGTPALFVHPAEAGHGDLGMIVGGDVIIALSNSGETPELAPIIAYSRRFALTLIAMVGREQGALQAAADIALVLPSAPEACPMGLAPTTSTTMMMALGDAMAVALMDRRGFAAEDFRRFHPGGQLGRQLMRVADLMHGGSAVPLIAAGATMAEAVIEMSAKAFGCVGVVSAGGVSGGAAGDGGADQIAGRLVGIITDGDLRRHMGAQLLAEAVDSIMTPSPKTIRPGALAAEALRIMNDGAITSLFVVDQDRRPIGIVHIHDCLRSGVA